MRALFAQLNSYERSFGLPWGAMYGLVLGLAAGLPVGITAGWCVFNWPWQVWGGL